MISFKKYLSESNIFQDKYLDGHEVVLKEVSGSSKDVMSAWFASGYKLGDSFTTASNYKGDLKNVVVGKGSDSMILKDSEGKYIKVIASKTAITTSLHHVSSARKGDAKTTAQQEEASLFVFQQALQVGKFPSEDELKKIYPTMPDDWLVSFKAQYKVIATELNGAKFNHYERDGDFMKFISVVVKKHGFSKKDTWNPSDIWLLKESWSKSSTLYKLLDRAKSISSVNMILRNAFRKRDIVGISLKKTNAVSKWELVNVDKVFDQDDYLIDWKSGKLSFATSAGKLTTSELSFLMEDGINAQVRMFPVKDKTSVQVSFKQKGGKAEFGKTPKDIMRLLLKDYNLTFPSWQQVAQTKEEFLKDKNRYLTMLRNVNSSPLKISTEIKPNAFINFMSDLYDNNTESYAKSVISSKLQSLHLANSFSIIRKKSKDEFDKVVTEFALSSQKKGSAFGPFAKIS